MGLLDDIDSLGEIDPMDMAANKTPYEESPSYQELFSGDEQEKWREATNKDIEDLIRDQL